jgi:hypothetical protein
MIRKHERVTKAAAFMAAYGGYIAAVGSVAGAAVGGYSAYQAGQTAKKTGEYNKEMQARKETDALARGADQAAQIRTRARRVAAAQVEGSAMSGVEVNSGTPLALLTETAGLGELDALRAINNSQREAWGHKAVGELDSFSGRSAARAGLLNAGGTMLTGAASTYSLFKN